jgi:hypothetical protein
LLAAQVELERRRLAGLSFTPLFAHGCSVSATRT